MSELEKLLDGVEVEWKPLGEIAELKRGRVMSKEYLAENAGKYPVYSSQTANNGQIGKIDSFDFDGETVTWTTDGANAGTIFHRVGKFSITNVCGLIKVKDTDKLDYKFLYYWLSIEAKKHVYSGMGNPKLMSNQVAKIPIPIPSLEIQQKIVDILDKFTKHTTELTAELTTELIARKQQYNYYREQLLSFGEGEVEWKSLGEVVIKSYSGSTPKAGDPKYYNNGIIPWLRTQEVKFADIEKTEIKITDYAVKNTAVKWIPVNCVIIAISGATAGRSAINKIPLTTNQHCLCLEINPKKALYRYVFHWVSFNYENLKNLGQGARNDLNSGIIKNYKIPVPPVEEQERIVSILDKFDILTNSISEGLPKEIELRKKQYEYYRDLLLTFPKDNIES
ncbi:restriction endonuclease subunit S [Sphingobacterium spiritivorum]|uniref:restriction endonuclease subunit S n=1 Tax=Sphingobacterium spiritivorum TaxID=258 RepID=UPI003DA62524